MALHRLTGIFASQIQLRLFEIKSFYVLLDSSVML